MAKRMLIDATHSEETRVAVVDGNRLVDFDYESKVRKQLKGSIFLAKVTRVEPSLQAAFVNFGGNRHGFLPFTEIHPDYYRIPIADREALLAEQEREMEARLAAEEAEDEEEAEEEAGEEDYEETEIIEVNSDEAAADDSAEEDDDEDEEEAEDEDDHEGGEPNGNLKAGAAAEEEDADEPNFNKEEHNVSREEQNNDNRGGRRRGGRGRRGRGGRERGGRDRGGRGGRGGGRMASHSRRVEIVGGDGIEGDQPIRPSLRKNYKIQEVVKRGQIMLIQVSKEERGNKGAAVSTYLSLPGRYCVLMPNSPRAGGVSRKIANYKERKRMREILNELKVPQGMSVIMRTAGTSRTKAEIKRDLDYLMKLWDNIRELTLSSTAPAMVHEEGNLIRRSIRDIYESDIEELLVAGDEGYKFARDFMKMMIPSHAKRVKEYKDDQIPLFHRYQVESQISEIGTPSVTLPSGGYLVINPTEALISVDVNSGKATKERHIEETALRTNLEAAEEVARQLKLRDLGGLVVIDFIDMEDRRNNRKVENKLKNALSGDRARIQIGRISSFGLLELSRQRLNPSLTEAQHEKCHNCQGVGHVRTIDATAITALRALEEEGIRDRADAVTLHVANDVALYILNNKRTMLAEIEARYGFQVSIHVDKDMPQSQFLVEPVQSKPKDDGDEDAEEDNNNGRDEQKQQQARHNNNNNNNNNNGEQRERGGRRRRGRRGGRRRNGGRDERGDNDSGNDRDDDVVSADTPSEDQAVKHDSAKEKPDVAEREEAAEDEKLKGKGRARKAPAKKAAKKAAGKGEPAADKKAEDKKPEEKKEPAKVAEPAKPSNDTAPAKAKEYEVVNEAPAQKKKGWWSKMTE